MTTSEINTRLTANYEELKDWCLHGDGKSKWNFAPPQKWTTGQHVLHLVQSTQPLVKGLWLPSFILKYKFGKANRSSRSYDEIIQKYHLKLEEAGNVVSPFSQKMYIPTIGQREELLQNLQTLNTKLQNQTAKMSDTKLDTVLLPHPLMGRMTLREMLIWNTYHTSHHLSILRKSYV